MAAAALGLQKRGWTRALSPDRAISSGGIEGLFNSRLW